MIYEYLFNLNPIAYTFGKEHKLKILISSSNYPRFQSNPNIPVNNYDFFRRIPGQDFSYEFGGKTYTPRTATNSIHFTPELPSQIIVPLRGRQIETCGEPDSIFVTNLTDTTATLNWRGASGTSLYLVRYKTVDANSWTEVQVQNTNLEIVDLEPAEYLWEVRSICQDTNLTSIQDTFITTFLTSILENENNQHGSIYPNPSKDFIMIDLIGENWNSDARIINQLGQVVKEISINSSQIKINTQGLIKGEYIIEISNQDNKKLFLPFIKL